LGCFAARAGPGVPAGEGRGAINTPAASGRRCSIQSHRLFTFPILGQRARRAFGDRLASARLSNIVANPISSNWDRSRKFHKMQKIKLINSGN